MPFTFSVRNLLAMTAPLLVAGLASCSHTPETTTAAAPVAASSTLATAPAPAPAPVVVAAPKPALAKVLPKTRLPKPATPAAPAPVTVPVAVAAPAAPASELAAPAPAAPATRTQAGRVLDENGHPLVGATVLLRGSAKGTSTDASGSYTLEVPAGENTFLIGYGGYEDETASSRDGQPLNVTLLPSPDSKSKSRRGRR